MDDYLTKPLHVAALAQALDRWIAQGQARAGGEAAEPSAPVAAAAPEAPLMDFARLEEFKEFDDGDLTMTREVIGLFLTDTPARIEAIEQAVAAQDAGALSRAAHALKGGASNVGAKAIQQHADALEAAAKEAMPADAALRAAKLRELWDETRKALAAWG
jgi:HPt (histidine-containing phosphotransfer) domain-containing protein